MKIIESGVDIYDPDFRAEVPTEICLYESVKNMEFIEYSLVNMAGEKMFHLIGGQKLQQIIDRVTEKRNKKLIFIFQHVWVHKFRWYGNIVFSPHVTLNCPDNILPVPHYPITIGSFRKNDNRDLLYSFVGAVHTHRIRQTIFSHCPENCILTDGWMAQPTRELFVSHLKRSKFTLCPQGTGIGTVRLFESLAMGSIPVILADGYVPPLHWLVDWTEFSIVLPESLVGDIDQLLSGYKEDQIEQMSARAYEVWSTYFSADNMHKVVELELNKLTAPRNSWVAKHPST